MKLSIFKNNKFTISRLVAVLFLSAALNSCASKDTENSEQQEVESDSANSEADQAMVDGDATSEEVGTLDNNTQTEAVIADIQVGPENSEIPIADAMQAPGIEKLPESNQTSSRDIVAQEFQNTTTASTTQESTPVVNEAKPLNSKSTTYVVLPGDTLAKIAKKIYGSVDAWKKLAKDNGISNPNLILPGDQLSYRGEEANEKFKNGINQDVYTVSIKKGDTLSKIAAENYGSKSFWRVIWKLNKDVIPDANKIEIGQSVSLIKIDKNNRSEKHAMNE